MHEILYYKNENSHNLWQRITINLTKAKKFASLASQTWVATWEWKQIIQEHNETQDSSKDLN